MGKIDSSFLKFNFNYLKYIFGIKDFQDYYKPYPIEGIKFIRVLEEETFCYNAVSGLKKIKEQADKSWLAKLITSFILFLTAWDKDFDWNLTIPHAMTGEVARMLKYNDPEQYDTHLTWMGFRGIFYSLLFPILYVFYVIGFIYNLPYCTLINTNIESKKDKQSETIPLSRQLKFLLFPASFILIGLFFWGIVANIIQIIRALLLQVIPGIFGMGFIRHRIRLMLTEQKLLRMWISKVWNKMKGRFVKAEAEMLQAVKFFIGDGKLPLKKDQEDCFYLKTTGEDITIEVTDKGMELLKTKFKKPIKENDPDNTKNKKETSSDLNTFLQFLENVNKEDPEIGKISIEIKEISQACAS